MESGEFQVLEVLTQEFVHQVRKRPVTPSGGVLRVVKMRFDFGRNIGFEVDSVAEGGTGGAQVLVSLALGGETSRAVVAGSRNQSGDTGSCQSPNSRGLGLGATAA